MNVRDWVKPIPSTEFPMHYRAQFHAEAVLECRDPASGLTGLSYIGRRGPYIFDFISPRDNHITVTFLTEKPGNRGKVCFVRIKTGKRNILLDLRPVIMVKPINDGEQFREIPVDYYRVMDFYQDMEKDNEDTPRIWNMHPFNALKRWKSLAQTSV